MARLETLLRVGRGSGLPALSLSALCLFGLLGPAVVRSDDVVLTNGKTYENVVAETIDAGVRIHLSFGEIVLPHDQVARVVSKPSAYGEYLARSEQLRALHSQSGEAWLELARWAAVNDFSDGVRQAGLMAASIDPTLDGLPAVLRPLGYVYDESSAQWLSEDELMRLRGYVLDGGEWVTVEERERRVASTRAYLERERERIADERARELEYLREREAAAAYQPPAVGIPYYWGWGWGGGWLPPAVEPPIVPERPQGPAGQPPATHTPPPRHTRGGFDSVATRQSGSFLPLSKSPSAVVSSASGNGGGGSRP